MGPWAIQKKTDRHGHVEAQYMMNLKTETEMETETETKNGNRNGNTEK